jgi:hypothetical protein
MSINLQAAAGVAVLSAVALLFFTNSSRAGELMPCDTQSGDQQIECVFGVIEKNLLERGVAGGFEIFSQAYERYPAFVATGCHRHAHRVGDLVYYRLYVGAEDFDSIDFPQSTTACGYGMYHGLLEHLIQDHPLPSFVTETCHYLTKRLETTMNDIQLTCYHGAGHGFTLAEAERTPKSDWGSISAFTKYPLEQCDALTEATATDIEQCKEGVFNVVVDWMDLKQYGFAYNDEAPFAACSVAPASSTEACYYEMAQKLDRLAAHDPVRLADIVAGISDTHLRELSFSVGIAGVVQNVILQGGQRQAIERCRTLSDAYYLACMQSIVHGMFEHGSPQREYVEALNLCAEVPSDTAECYRAVAGWLPRFYTPDERLAVCAQFPAEYKDACIAHNS